ncbi:ferredoxin [Streptomyces syringium]|uniref:ferredoxin n=1 Tax=Streptomyces syringium TaxID=76729 RepID=UPI003AAB5E05
MQIRIDRERCLGAGMCALTAPEVFDQDTEGGRVLLLDTDPPPARSLAIRRAAYACPSGAITVTEPRPAVDEPAAGAGAANSGPAGRSGG